MHFAALGLLRVSRSPKNVEVAVSSSPRKFRVKLDGKIKRELLFFSELRPSFLREKERIALQFSNCGSGRKAPWKNFK